ncbi:hypothetical protein [Actinokineospora spheciospongiae]|uniref:hypothetical protein n=1 Tax=Actinokineospora spheciospongiae TaxID=909613 RepID=UPI0015E870AC|nr:hypothetical protein [Actinokineospora spheciospongiae]
MTAAYGEVPQLDLHLNGASVKEHATPADMLARFVAAAASVSKEITKSIRGLSRLTSRLMVSPAPGSVRLTFEPEVSEAPPSAFSPERLVSAEVVGLRKLVTLLVVAEDTHDPSGAEMLAALEDLNPSARRAVKRLALAAINGDYEISGSWRDPTRGSVNLNFSTQAARRLKEASSEATEKITEIVVFATIDGWQWSSGLVSFLPSTGPPFRASVPENLAATVAQFGAERDLQVRARLRVVTKFAQGSDRPSGRGYFLTKIEARQSKIGSGEQFAASRDTPRDS